MNLNNTAASTTFADAFAAALGPKAAENTHTTFCAFSHTVADRIGVPHKVLKRHIEELLESQDRCLCEDSYTFEDSKGREKWGYMLDKETLTAVLTGFYVERLADELMETTAWEVEVEA